MTLRTGQTFDRYRIEAVLGEGGMGAVYRAFDTRLQRVVALKIVRPGPDGSTGGTARVLREARAAAALQHPNAVVIHDVGEQDGEAYIAMEYVEGSSLRECMSDHDTPIDSKGESAGVLHARRPIATKLRWLVDVAHVLDAAHAKGIVHRDVKPENVMLRRDGTVKVLDFGIARRVRTDVDPSGPTLESETVTTKTGEGVVVGTPAYMAPEQIRNETIDARTDQFSWAVMAYEVLSGKLPWKPRDHVAIIASIVMDEPAPLTTVAPEVPARIARVIDRALSKSPAARFASMEELVASLEDRAPEPRRTRSPWLPVGLALVVLVTLPMLALSLRKPDTKPPAPSTSASASAVPHAITDHPDPLGCNAAAIKAHKEGLHAMRQVGWDVAQHAFEAAMAADPGCAAPHLRLSLMGPGLSIPSSRVRSTWQTAASLRANLTDRERDLLDASEPCIARDPPDRHECARRALPLADKYPLDAEVLAWVADFAHKTAADDEALLTRAVKIDPLYADAWQGIASARMRKNDTPGAIEALDKCIAAAPASNDCRFERVRIDFHRADCKSAEQHARDWVGRTQGQAFPQRFLANALAAQGESREVVEESLRNRWAVLEPDVRTFFPVLESAHVAVFYGDFAAARTLSRKLLELAEGNDYARHAEAATFAARLAAEEGRSADVLAIASSFRKGARVWPYPTVFTPYAWTAVPEGVPSLLSLEHDAGGLTTTQFVASLGAWRDDASATGRVSQLQALAFGSALLPSTKAEAEKTIDGANLALVPLRLDSDGALLRGNIGRLFQRAGRSDDALAYLRAAAGDCNPLQNAFDAVHAHLWLGELLEARGDTAGACTEYRVVLDRWGKTKSVTAERARARRGKLACG